jgi:hypothetical protein
LLRTRARSLCYRAEPSPPSLSPFTGPHCPHAMHDYKRDLPVHFVHASGFTIRRFWSTRSPRNRSRMRDRLLHPPRSSSPRHVGAPNHLRAAPRGVADFPDHQSHPAPFFLESISVKTQITLFINIHHCHHV